MQGNRIRRVAAVLTGSAVLLALGAVPGQAYTGEHNDVESRKRQATATGPGTARPAPSGTAPGAGDTVRLVVGFDEATSVSAAARSLGAAGVRAADSAPLAKLGAHTVSVARSRSAEVTAALRSAPGVAYVEVDTGVRADAVVPNDPKWSDQGELRQITVPDAWSLTTGAAVTVAVIDGGVDAFGDLSGAVLDGRDFVGNDPIANDENGHDTAVASLIAARGDNGAGIAGTRWACRILPVKVLGPEGDGSIATTAAGIVYAADRGAKIINASLGTSQNLMVLRDAVAYAQSRGSLVVASAGNDAVRTSHYPAAYPGVIAVGGTDETSDVFLTYDPGTFEIYGSNYGPEWVDVAAPWCTVAADWESRGYADFCGTSASAPLVAGTIALMKSRHPRATNTALVQSLTRTARATPTTGFTRFGEIRAGQAVSGVDTTAPRITGATPRQSARFRGAVTVGATGVSDTGSGVSHVALYADGRCVGRDTTAPYAVRFDGGRLNRTVALQWRVYDRAGNQSRYDRKVIADNRGPSVTIGTAPRNGAKVRGTVTVKVGANDPAGVARVEILINGKVVARDTKAPWTFKIKVGGCGKKMTVRVRAVDRLGNVTTGGARTWKR
ncbi:S8 family serine peptidase [Actinoplanes xinjiangensis]|uniref:S8 family serine peptidase n=1 Tax=Actinoplanes xinjiangensis TaxID=512350 RepID=UPI00130D4A5E|nr:S8 family serine peptidase [Actinoplanes xinjiangensis]